MSSMDKLVLRLKAVTLLRMVKQHLKYSELIKITGLDQPTLNKYFYGIVVPNFKRAKQLIDALKKYVNLADEVELALKKGLIIVPDGGNIFIKNLDLANLIAYEVYEKYKDKKADKILSVENGGLLFATLIASLLKVKLVYAARGYGFYSENILEERYWPYRSKSDEIINPRLKQLLTLPKDAIKKDEKILIIDDIIWSGETLKALARFVKRLGGIIVAVFCLATVSEEIVKSLKEELNVEVEFLTSLTHSSSQRML